MKKLPSPQIISKAIDHDYPEAKRDDISRWSNSKCTMLNFLNENWENIKLFVKKTIIRHIPIEKFEADIQILKWILKEMIPQQSFIPYKDEIFAICSPIRIRCDVLDWRNYRYILELAKQDKKFLKELEKFIEWFYKLLSMWHLLDLYWEENLVLSEDKKLYYVDSFLVFHENDMIREWTMKKIKTLEELVDKVKFLQNPGKYK